MGTMPKKITLYLVSEEVIDSLQSHHNELFGMIKILIGANVASAEDSERVMELLRMQGEILSGMEEE